MLEAWFFVLAPLLVDRSCEVTSVLSVIHILTEDDVTKVLKALMLVWTVVS
jgi:hypothetical protein